MRVPWIMVVLAALLMVGCSAKQPPAPSPKVTTTPEPAAHKAVEVAVERPVGAHKPVILGSTRAEVEQMFKDWRRDRQYEQRVDPRAIKFVDKDLIVVVDFDRQGIAEGVAFLSVDDSDPTGQRSFVNRAKQELIDWAKGNGAQPVRPNVTTRYPVELYVGKVHE